MSTNNQHTDAWDRPVTVSNGLFRYRNRAIDIHAVNEVRTKGKRVLINHYNRNDTLPTAIVVCKDAEAANALYEYILKAMYGDCDDDAASFTTDDLPSFNSTNLIVNNESMTLWSFLGCGRRGC